MTTTFKPGYRFRVYGGRVAHVFDKQEIFFGSYELRARCGVAESVKYANPADDRPLCKECARLMRKKGQPMTTDPHAALVEEIGKALFIAENPGPGTTWEQAKDHESYGAIFLNLARAVLPIVLREKAGAWDDGFKQGGPMHDEDYGDPDAHTRNPYRQEATDGR